MRIFKIKYLLTILISIISIMPIILIVNRNSTEFYDETNLNTKNDLVTNNRISLGDDYFAFIDWKGYLYTWGNNDYGQLGHGNTLDLDVPKKIPGLNNVKEVSISHYHSSAITESGDLYTWGHNLYGQLGHGDRTMIYYEPKKVLGLNNVKEVSLGSFTSAAITKQGDLYTWGSNIGGKLGHGDTINIYEPKKVSRLNNVKEVSLGSFISAAITERGDLYTWGNNFYGQLGHGDSRTTHIPKKVSRLNNVKEVSISQYHSSAITKSGDLYTWGKNHVGQLGHGDTTMIYEPKKVSGLINVKEVSISSNDSAAITESGDLYTWGSNISEPTKMIGLPKQPIIGWMNIVIHPTWHSDNSGQIGFKYMVELYVGDIIDPKGTYTLFKNDIKIRSEHFALEFNVMREVLINNLEEGNYSLKVQFFKDGLSYFEDKLQETITLTKESIENPENEVIGSEIHEDNENIIFNKNSLNVLIKGKLGSVDNFEFAAKNIDGYIISSSPAIKISTENQITIFGLENDWSFGRLQDFHINLKGSLGDSVVETQKFYTYEFLGFNPPDSSNSNILIMFFLIIVIILLSNGIFFYYVIKNNKETKLLTLAINESGYFLNDDYDEDFESSL